MTRIPSTPDTSQSRTPKMALDGPPTMRVHRAFPLNAEPFAEVLRAAFMTPQCSFYIRAHGTIPILDAQSYRLRLSRDGAQTLEFSLADLQTRFQERTVAAVMQCAGNRRTDFAKHKHVPGEPWQLSAIGNAAWTGVALADVLAAIGVDRNSDQHVAFACHDDIAEAGERFKYGVSIPAAKATAPETLLAYAMNGEPLSAEHGFPLRVVTPGFAGARSPKWLASINVQDAPSDNFVQQKVYKLFPPDVTKATADQSEGVVINDMPVTSAICIPADGATVRPGRTTVRGYAIGASAAIAQVDISSDGGLTWSVATLEPDAAPSQWSWVFWTADLDLQRGDVHLVVRARDTDGNAQPESSAAIWNFAGYLCTAWHRICITAA